jgi:hypothetical protein
MTEQEFDLQRLLEIVERALADAEAARVRLVAAGVLPRYSLMRDVEHYETQMMLHRSGLQIALGKV